MRVIKVEGSICTNSSGFKKIISIYDNLSEFKDETVILDYYNLEWFDANLCALLEGVLYKLEEENNLSFKFDKEYLEENFDVLIRNGFGETGEVKDCKKSTLPLKAFYPNNESGFEQYIREELLQHRGMPKLSKSTKSQIEHDLIEIFNNVDLHANTSYPVFICGQYYPKGKDLKLTIVDLGDGFLPQIKEVTKDSSVPVIDSSSAIKWAIKGNSVKPKTLGEPGGQGLSGIYNFCKESKGVLHIASGDAYWGSDFVGTILGSTRSIESTFSGATINLSFKL